MEFTARRSEPDLEQKPRSLKRKQTWASKFSLESEKTAVNSDTTSVRIFEQGPYNWISDWLIRWRRKSALGTKLSSTDANLVGARYEFITAVTGGEPPRSTVFLDASNWYIAYLESRVNEAWISLCRPLLMNVSLLSQLPSEHDMSVVFQFLATIVQEFKRGDVALVQIVDTLYNERLLNETDNDRSHAIQLVFAALGWITILYNPEPVQEANYLQIISPLERCIRMSEPSRPRRRQRINSSTFRSFQQGMDHADQSLSLLLRRFGDIMPKHNEQFFGSQLRVEAPPETQIDLSAVCFHTLQLVSIKIEWVDCLSLHLEFNSRSKVLKLFRFPSLCMVMCCSQDNSPLSRIFWDSGEGNIFSIAEIGDARDFFQDVLLTYRLIFGLHKRSYAAFNKLSRAWDPILRRDTDPLLHTLCGKSWKTTEARQIWEEMEVDDPSRYYCSSNDFPFLGRRLIELQSYVKRRSPSSTWTRWFDRNDPSGWWNFWAVVVLGGVSLFFILLQSGLQIAQVVYGKQQLSN